MAGKKASTKRSRTKKVTAKKANPKKTIAEPRKNVKYTAEQIYTMIQQAAYFAAKNDGYSKEPSEYWEQAEASIQSMVNH